MNDQPGVLQALRLQSSVCRADGSPMNADLLEKAAENWAEGGAVRALMAPWAEAGLRAQFDAAAPLRLVGALHELALSGDDAALSAAYAARDAAGAWAAAQDAMVRHGRRLAAFMTHEPQTNEVRRSVGLVGGFLEVAKATGLPMRCFEIAASAGLNLSWDQYRYRLGEAVWGDPLAALAMDAEWEGPPPPVAARIEVIERAACDRRPTDLHDPDQRRRLMAYIWPDQLERLARIRMAIDIALTRGVVVEAADAVDWTRDRVAPRPGAATVLYHSVFWQYMPPESQAALLALIHDIGGQASSDAPFAWLRMEPSREGLMLMEVRLTLWPGGEERLLATTHPHAATVRWLAG